MIKLFWNTHNQNKPKEEDKDYIWGIYHKNNSDKWIFEILDKVQFKLIQSEKDLENNDTLIIVDSSIEKKNEYYEGALWCDIDFKHPDYKKVHNPYWQTEGGRKGLFELAKEFKFASPNETLGTYFAKYERVPTYNEMYNFLTRPKSKSTKRGYNALEKHHISLVEGSPTRNLQLTLNYKNREA